MPRRSVHPLTRATAAVKHANVALDKARGTRELRLRALAEAFAAMWRDTVTSVNAETGHYFPGIDHLDGGGGVECYARVLYPDPGCYVLGKLSAGARLRILARSDDDEGDTIHVETVDRPVPIGGWVSIDYVIGTNVPVPK